MPKEITKQMLEEVYGDLFKAAPDNKRRVRVYCWEAGYKLFCDAVEKEFGSKEDPEAIREEGKNNQTN